LSKRRYGQNAYYLDAIRYWWQYILKQSKPFSRRIVQLASYELEPLIAKRHASHWPLYATVGEVKALLECGELEKIIAESGLPQKKKVLACVRAFLEEAEVDDLQPAPDCPLSKSP
jgi:hypothetical protein